jgi:hypothetical protein
MKKQNIVPANTLLKVDTNNKSQTYYYECK